MYQVLLSITYRCSIYLKFQSRNFYYRQLGINIIWPRMILIYIYATREQQSKYLRKSIHSCWISLEKFPTLLKNCIINSAGCGGQKINILLYQRFEKMSHFFPLRGPSFLSYDRDFGVLKRTLRRHNRLYLCSKWNFISHACNWCQV